MARDGNGTYSLPEAAFVYDTVIDETAVNSDFSDIAAALTASIAKDGQTVPTANLPMGTYRHTGVGNASARDQYAAMGQVQDGGGIWCGTAGGTADAITLTPTPAISAYATGQRFEFKAGASANTSAVTFAISGLATIAGQVNGAACSGGEIEANKWYRITLSDTSTAQIEKIGAAASGGFLVATNNLSDVANAATARSNIGAGTGNGTVTSIIAGTGLTGGTITTSGTIAVDVGTTASKIVQLDGSAKLPAVDGSQLTGISATDQIALDTIAITAARLMYVTSISDGSLGQGYQWELSTDTWGATSTNETFVSATPNYYSNTSSGYSSNQFTGGTPGETSHLSSFVAANAFDGNTGTYWQGNGTATLFYDLGSAKAITKMTIQDGTGNVYSLQPVYSDNGSSFTNAGTAANNTANGSKDYDTSAAGSHRYWGFSGSGNPQISELTGYTAAAVANMTLIPPSAVSVSSAPSVIDCRIIYKDDAGTSVLGTDFTVELSRDNGTTYTAATITTIGAFDATYSYIKARADVSAQPSGTSMLCRIKTLNSKSQRVGLISLNKEY
jgi:hypothetical protein